MHRDLSINTLCLAPAPLHHHVDTVARLGARGISPEVSQVIEAGAGPAAAVLRDAGLAVATMTHRSFAFATPELTAAARERLLRTIDLAAEAGAQSVIMTTGGRGAHEWGAAADLFAQGIAPCVEAARAAGIVLGIEPTSHLYADASIAHRLSDTVAIARKAGVSVMMDMFGCWFDSDIDDALAAAAPLSPLVQVSDYVYEDRSLPCRAVPGDGAVPWEQLVAKLARAGFTGWYDLEIIGPRLHAEGGEAGLARAAARMGEWLVAAGRPAA